MEDMNITSAQYRKDTDDNNICISAVIDGDTVLVPLSANGNRHYAEIMRQVNAGTLTIQDAD